MVYHGIIFFKALHYESLLFKRPLNVPDVKCTAQSNERDIIVITKTKQKKRIIIIMKNVLS